jgi:hypothetical protein
MGSIIWTHPSHLTIPSNSWVGSTWGDVRMVRNSTDCSTPIFYICNVTSVYFGGSPLI